MSDPEQMPEVGTIVHLCLVSEVVEQIHFICVPAVVLDVAPPVNPSPAEAVLLRPLRLALITPHGMASFRAIGYVPLAAHDFSGTWHFKHEHAAPGAGG